MPAIDWSKLPDKKEKQIDFSGLPDKVKGIDMQGLPDKPTAQTILGSEPTGGTWGAAIKAGVKVPLAVAGSMLAFPFAGLAGLSELAAPGKDRLGRAARRVEQVGGIPSKLITTPEEAKSMEHIEKYGMWPIRKAGEGWGMMGKATGIPYAEPIGATMGEAAAMGALGGESVKLLKMRGKAGLRGLSAKNIEKLRVAQESKYGRYGVVPEEGLLMEGTPTKPVPIPQILKAENQGLKVMDLIGKRRAEIDKGMLDSEIFINQFERDFTPIELEAIPFIRQGIKDPSILKTIGKEDLIPIIQKPSPILRAATEKIGKYYDESFKFLQDNWGDVGFVEDYVTHIWDIPKGRKSEIVNYFATRNPFLKKRIIPTLEEGIKLGLKPKTTNIAELLRIYDQYKIKTAHNLNFAKGLKDLVGMDGEPLMMRSDKAPVDWVTIDHPAMNRAMVVGKIGKEGVLLTKVPVKVHPEIAKEVKIIFDKPFSHGAIQALETVNAFAKKGMLTLSLFHHHALTESAFSTGIGWKAIKQWNPHKIYRALKTKDYEIFKQQELAKDGIDHGLTFGALSDVQRNRVANSLQSLERIAKDTPGAKQLTTGIRKANELWDAALWDYYHNSLKLWAYEKNVFDSLKFGKKKLGRDMLPEEITAVKKQMASFVNDSFGGQNWEMNRVLGNPKVRQMLHWTLLAPDWCVDSKTRAMTKIGWKYYNELSVNDEILAFDPKTQKMKWLPLIDKYVNENYDDKIIKVKNWHRCIMMTPEHTCYVHDRYKGGKIVKASELNASHSILRNADFDTPFKESFDDDFIKLVGWLVTDGYVKKSYYKLRNGTIKEYRYGKITQSKPQTVEMLKELGLIYNVEKYNSDHDDFIANHQKHIFTIPVHKFQIMEQEKISDGLNWEFLSKLTKRQLELLYDTMMLGDGTGQNRFCGKEKEVFYMTLIQTMLGLPSTFYQQEKNCWRTRIIKKSNLISCCGHSNNKEEIDYKGIIWCPSVDTGFWLAEREGLMFITGNTFSVLKQAAAPAKGIALQLKAKKAPTEMAYIQQKLAGKTLTRQGAKFWAKAGLYFNLIAQSVNYAMTKKEYGAGRFTWENPEGHYLNIFIGRNEDGTERYMRMGKQFREVLEWGMNPIKKIGAKLSPGIRESIRQVTAHDPGSGYPTEWAEKEGLATLPERAMSILEMPIPFSLRPYVKSRPGVFMFTFPTSKGMTNYKAVQLFKKALKDSDVKRVRKTYIDALQNNLDAESLFKSANSAIKADITYDNKKLANEILLELIELDPKAQQDALMLYKRKGVLTPEIYKQYILLKQKQEGVKKQKLMFGIK